MRAYLIILIYFGLIANCYCQTYTKQGIDFGENQYVNFCLSKDGLFTGVFKEPKKTEKTAEISKLEVIIWNNLKNEVAEKYEFELPSYCFQKIDLISFTDDNKYVYGNNSCGGYYIIERTTGNIYIGKIDRKKKNYEERYEIDSYSNGVFKIDIQGNTSDFDKGSGQFLSKYSYYLADANLKNNTLNILSKQKKNNYRKFLGGKGIDDVDTDIYFFINNLKNEKIYSLSENEKCLSRDYDPLNSTISLIINTEKESYNSRGKIVIYSLIEHRIIKEFQINIGFQGWIHYCNSVQISKDFQFLIYNDGTSIRKLNFKTLDNSILIKFDKGWGPFFTWNDFDNKLYYQISSKSSILGIFPLENNIDKGLYIKFNSPREDNVYLQANKTLINVCVSNPNNILYKAVEYNLNNKKLSDRDFEIKKNSCISSINKIVDLQEGQNTFEVVVLDNSGKEINREKRVLNYTPKQIAEPIINPIPKVITEKRLALVVGNSKYYNGNNLQNATNDADSLNIVLTSLGFKVIKLKNQTKQQLETAIKNFTVLLKDYDVGLFFYAGHGMDFNGENYIIPTDAEKLDKSDVQYRCVSTSWLQEKMAEAGAYNKTNIIILDACRNNPFRSWRSFDDSKIWTPPLNLPTGTIIEYAASQGQKASDGYGSNGLYTSILLKHIKTKGLEIEKVFKRVRSDLKQKGEQDPVTVSQLINDFYFVK